MPVRATPTWAPYSSRGRLRPAAAEPPCARRGRRSGHAPSARRRPRHRRREPPRRPRSAQPPRPRRRPCCGRGPCASFGSPFHSFDSSRSSRYARRGRADREQHRCNCCGEGSVQEPTHAGGPGPARRSRARCRRRRAREPQRASPNPRQPRAPTTSGAARSSSRSPATSLTRCVTAKWPSTSTASGECRGAHGREGRRDAAQSREHRLHHHNGTPPMPATAVRRQGDVQQPARRRCLDVDDIQAARAEVRSGCGRGSRRGVAHSNTRSGVVP